MKVVTIPRADFFMIPNYRDLKIVQAGPLWITILVED